MSDAARGGRDPRLPNVRRLLLRRRDVIHVMANDDDRLERAGVLHSTSSPSTGAGLARSMKMQGGRCVAYRDSVAR